MSTLKQLLREAGLDEDAVNSLIEQAEIEKDGAIENALEDAKDEMRADILEEMEYAKECALEAKAHEADCEALYGDYAEERAGVAYFGKGDVHINDAGEILGWD
mgnify:CR=1 FL=1